MSAPPRVVFLGNAPWSVPALEAIAGADDLELALVATRVPRPAGRGNRLRPTAVADAARRGALPIAEVETVRSGSGLDALVAAAPDVLALVAYGEILPARVLSLPTLGPVNLHFSLLPELRGASPVQGALLAGLEATGVTTILMDAGLDTGPILLRRELEIDEDDDAGSLGARLAEVGARVVLETVRGLAAGRLEPVAQDEARATYAPKLGPEDRWLDWWQPAETLRRRIRALAPEPGASTRYRDQVLKVYRAKSAAGGSGDPGALLAVDDEGLVVATGEGSLRLVEVAPAGGRRMSAAAFARGHRPRSGERLG